MMKRFFFGLTFAVVGLTVAVVGMLTAATDYAESSVTVTYAFVPKDQLSEAIKGKDEALEIEAAWAKDARTKPHYPLNLIKTHYSIVVFVENTPRQMIWGRIGIPVQGPKHPLVLNVDLSPGYAGTYVVDGGGVALTKIPSEPKPYQWLEFHSE